MVRVRITQSNLGSQFEKSQTKKVKAQVTSLLKESDSFIFIAVGKGSTKAVQNAQTKDTPSLCIALSTLMTLLEPQAIQWFKDKGLFLDDGNKNT